MDDPVFFRDWEQDPDPSIDDPRYENPVQLELLLRDPGQLELDFDRF